MNEKEEAIVKSGLSLGLAVRALVRYITIDGCPNYKTLKYWRTIVNKDNRELNKNVSSILNRKEKGGLDK